MSNGESNNWRNAKESVPADGEAVLLYASGTIQNLTYAYVSEFEWFEPYYLADDDLKILKIDVAHWVYVSQVVGPLGWVSS